MFAKLLSKMAFNVQKLVLLRDQKRSSECRKVDGVTAKACMNGSPLEYRLYTIYVQEFWVLLHQSPIAKRPNGSCLLCS